MTTEIEELCENAFSQGDCAWTVRIGVKQLVERLTSENEALREALEEIERRCADYERINLVGVTPAAKFAGLMRNCGQIASLARAALSKKGEGE